MAASLYAGLRTRPCLNPDDGTMKLLSINVGLPQEIDWRGETVRTSIFKAPVAGRVRVTTLNVEGDRQSDLSVHGGSDKAVYAYPSEHYAFWRTELPGTELPWGMFGENFTTEGLLERNEPRPPAPRKRSARTS